MEWRIRMQCPEQSVPGISLMLVKWILQIHKYKKPVLYKT